MAKLVIAGAVLHFEDGPGWKWFQWNGEVEVRTTDHPFRIDGQPVALESDVIQLQTALIGKAYKGTGFDDTPGAATVAVVTVDASTLTKKGLVNGQGIVNEETKGRFQLTVTPSLKAAAPPIPDPVVVKTGTWSVKKPAQSKVDEAR